MSPYTTERDKAIFAVVSRFEGLTMQAGEHFCLVTVYHATTMVRAFIMVKTAAGKSTDLQSQIREVEGILDANVVAGKYDIIAEAAGEEVYTVIHTVATQLHELDGVMDTRTYICLE